ncbi:cellulose synthase [Nocardiopsis gilva YIM 90087]|uniref:Cellulose synthase n=1 Tax=Nocardiopsis gilva YIM 90087 TaxID=1235441 RepID=A0A223S6J9_9ACTN|nr:hypothetical protein [Nocardiopsis gilva]ASU83757.1 cellulose synthase [Nocardiopsis gilva YIM 90087]
MGVPEQLPIAGPMLGAALTVVGLLISWMVWRRRGSAAGLRGVAWSLLPLAAGLMGLMTIVWRLVFDLSRFFASLIFNPIVWAGVVVAGLAVVLWVVSGIMRARGIGTGGAKPAPKAAETGGGAAPEIAGAQAAPASSPKQPKQPKQAAQSAADDDFSDIEALLRKRGIE